MNTSNTSARPESPLLDFGPFGRRPKGWEGAASLSCAAAHQRRTCTNRVTMLLDSFIAELL